MPPCLRVMAVAFQRRRMTMIKEVYFDQYCSKCLFEKKPEDEDPCNECLYNPGNEDSHKPVNFKEKPKRKRRTNA